MSLKILSITLLLLSMCVCCHSSEGTRGRGRMPPCSIYITKLNMSANVLGKTYREQAASKPCVKAIIFNTKTGQICADPDAQWVKDLIGNMTGVCPTKAPVRDEALLLFCHIRICS